jgi:hypothetical protein
MRKTAVLVFLASIALAAHARPARAATPGEVAAAAKAAPAAVDLATEVARVPFAAAELLYLPMGTGEIVLSPLPGIKLGDGLKHLGKGLIAPFKLGIAVLRLPFNVLKHAGEVVEVVPVADL